MAKNTPPAAQSDADKALVDEAQKRFKLCQEWEGEFRKNFDQDLKFANADAYNNWQWEQNIKQARDDDRKPALTINMVQQHNLLIINEMKKNTPGVTVKATGGEATYESAQGIKALIQHIQYRSSAETAYDVATEFQVSAGFGVWRVETDYVNDTSFDQEILIKAVYNPLMVYFDHLAKEKDKSDARYCFVFDDCDKDQFELKYPQYAGAAGQTVLGNGNEWLSKDKIRICEYWRITDEKVTLYAMPNGTLIRSDQLPRGMSDVKERAVKARELLLHKVQRIVIVGNRVCEQTDWPGRYIPIVPLVGTELVVDGIMDRRGHTRALIDPQRMYNYWSSAAVEYGALQSKTPYIAPAEAIEGYETYWNSANQDNFAVLPYRAFDDAGQVIPPPQRQQPPMAAPVAITGMQIAQVEMMRASGQFQSQLGEAGNERTGIAITRRQDQGDTATYHFADNRAIALRHTAKIILDLIPKIYDTKRVLNVLAPDGAEYAMTLDPQAKQVFVAEMQKNGRIAKAVLNPMLGMYDVEADVGPTYATRREEAFEAFKLILTQAPNLTAILGDILFRAGDFPFADEAGERLRRMVPPQALGIGPSPELQAALADNANLKTMLQRAIEEVALAQTQIANKERADRIDAFKAASDAQIGQFDAITKRIKALIDKNSKTGAEPISPGEVREIVLEVLNEAATGSLNGGGPVGDIMA